MYKRLMMLLIAVLALGVLPGCSKKQESAEEIESAVEKSTADSDSTQTDIFNGYVSAELPEEEFGPAYLSCELPKGFKVYEGEEGLYVNKNYPNDLASISYDIADDYAISIEEMTQDMYQNMLESDFLRNYGDEVTVNIKSYKAVNVDGRAGIKILTEYQFKGTDYEQLVYILYNGDEVHCLTFTQEKDAGWLDDFEECGETLHFIEAES